MPSMPGLEVIKQVCKLKLTNQVKQELVIIANSAFISQKDYQQCIDAGANYFLDKPIRIEQMMEIADNLF